MKRSLIILRGLPGSGKTSLAEILDAPICSADDYFMKDGKYLWNKEELGSAHQWCLGRCEFHMRQDAEKIIVANTSTTARELKPYYDLAQKYGYQVFSVIVENRHEGKNIHNVPEETLQKMAERFSIKLL